MTSTSTDSVARLAFSLNQAASLTGVSARRLRAWARRGLFVPADTDGRDIWFYTFRDLVGLRLAVRLRDDYRAAAPAIEQVVVWLRDYMPDRGRWPAADLHLSRQRAATQDIVVTARSDEQVSSRLSLRAIDQEMRDRVRALHERSAADYGQIERRRGVQGGEPVFRGTRIPVAGIVASLSGGMSIEDMLKNFPDLDRRDISTALGQAELGAHHKRAG